MQDADELVRIAEGSGPRAPEAVRAVVRLGHEAFDAVVESVRRNDDRAGGNLRYALVQMHQAQVVPKLVGLLADSKMSLLAAVFRALGRSRDRRALEPLTSYIVNPDNRPARRWAAAGALGE